MSLTRRVQRLERVTAPSRIPYDAEEEAARYGPPLTPATALYRSYAWLDAERLELTTITGGRVIRYDVPGVDGRALL
ncbi:hypothetical protein [Streptomyces sp. NBC_01439]|uniref:hypothetical protein n=1 Tax=Streptomyces sp. NBC_01439 TaxID=2903867 RepID=UPI002E291D9F|nr:hypothetical protein [Streptomyces sp. NBC_01439]